MTTAFRRQRQEDEDVAEAGELLLPGELKASLATMRPYLREHFKKSSWEKHMQEKSSNASDHTKNS